MNLFQLLFLTLLFCAAWIALPCLSGEEREVCKSLQEQFQSDDQWSGADGAYSIELASGKVLWLFGDTFIGTISDGMRKDNQMIHNSVALQDKGTGKMNFYWKKGKNAGSYLSEADKCWYWPGDGAYYNGKVYFFARRISLVKGKENDPFGFSWQKDELVVIDNPTDNPDIWQARHLLLPFSTSDFHLGCACFLDKDMLYVLGIKEKTKESFLARIALSKLEELDSKGFEFLSRSSPSRWCKDIRLAKGLWTQAATESSLCRLDSGFACVYTQKGMGKDIVARTADNIEGPWSLERLIYQVPEENNKRGFSYAAKLHPDQSCPEDRIVLTYSINPGTLEAHVKDPYAYFPIPVTVKLSDLNKIHKSGNN